MGGGLEWKGERDSGSDFNGHGTQPRTKEVGETNGIKLEGFMTNPLGLLDTNLELIERGLETERQLQNGPMRPQSGSQYRLRKNTTK